jgi:REP element-mobilizing transposase RayT
MKLPRQTLLPFGARERVVNRQIRERAAGKKVRPGLGRPPKRRATSEDAVVAHTKRRVIAPKTAVHVTLSVTKKVSNLRTRKKYALVKRAFAAAQFGSSAESPLGFRLIHFAVLGDHVHLLAEADSAQALTKGVQKITISMARLINVDRVRLPAAPLTRVLVLCEIARVGSGRSFAIAIMRTTSHPSVRCLQC